MSLDKSWYTEEWVGQGSAISLKIKSKVHDEQSAYQRIEIYETETFGTLMTLDGLVMVTDRDNFVYHEMMSHPALYTHPDPKRVLIDSICQQVADFDSQRRLLFIRRTSLR